MGDRIQVIPYLYARVGDRPGEARRLLEHFSEIGVSLMAYTLHPVEEGQTQMNFVTDRVEKLQEAARDAGVELGGPAQAFLIQGDDRIGVLHEHHLRLANAGVNVKVSSGICDEDGHFGFVLFVEPKDFDKAAMAFDFI